MDLSLLLELTSVGAGAILALAGLTLLGRSLFSDRARGRRRCSRCWYSMDGLAGLRCPECGRVARSERRLHRTRRRWRRAVFAAGIVALGLALAAGPVVRRHGWSRLIPTTALVVVLPRLEHDDARGLLARRIDGMWRWQARWLASSTVTQLNSPDAARRLAGAELLHMLSPRATPTPTVLAPRLADTDPEVRDALNRLLRRSAGARDVNAATIAIVRDAAIADSDPQIGDRIGETLGFFGESALPALCDILCHDDPDVRARAIPGLRRLIETSHAAVDVLIVAMDDTDPLVRRRAAGAVTARAPPDCHARLTESLRRLAIDRDRFVRSAAALRLEEMRAATLPAERGGP